MGTIEARKSTSLRLKRGLYEHVKERAGKDGRSVNNFLERIISEAVEYREPNEETRLAIEEARSERPYLKRYGSSKRPLGRSNGRLMAKYKITFSGKFKKDFKRYQRRTKE